MFKLTTLGAMALLASATAIMAQATIDPAIYPAATAGMTRHVFELPPSTDEDRYRVEIVVGTIMEVDCNTTVIRADIDEDDVKGYGYPYFTITDVSVPITTMMGCPDTPRTKKIVELQLGKDALHDYRSALPLVVYAPEAMKVGYRIWTTTGEVTGAEQP